MCYFCDQINGKMGVQKCIPYVICNAKTPSNISTMTMDMSVFAANKHIDDTSCSHFLAILHCISDSKYLLKTTRVVDRRCKAVCPERWMIYKQIPHTISCIERTVKSKYLCYSVIKIFEYS